MCECVSCVCLCQLSASLFGFIDSLRLFCVSYVWLTIAQDILTFEFPLAVFHSFFSTRNKRYSSTRFDFLSVVYACVSELGLSQ